MFGFGLNYFSYPINPIMNFFTRQIPFFGGYFPQYPQYPQYTKYSQYGNRQPVSIFQREHTTYHAGKGDLLVQNALRGLPLNAPEPPMCARYVKNAIVNSGLGNYVNGTGEETQYMLRNNMNFMEVGVKGNALSNIPKGTAVVYDAFDTVRLKDGTTKQIGEFGHVLLAKGDGTGISDRLESEIPISDNAHVFIPV